MRFLVCVACTRTSRCVWRRQRRQRTHEVCERDDGHIYLTVDPRLPVSSDKYACDLHHGERMMRTQ